MTVAYEIGLLKKYETSLVHEVKRNLLDGMLWGLKLRGCAISSEEINDLLKVQRFK
ncbi:hypothetical protein K8R47_02010 [archaeon]|nr:hypothetical protein [archaeon]